MSGAGASSGSSGGYASPAWDPVARAGASFLDIAGTAGGMTILFGRVLARMLPSLIDGPELRRTLHKMAVRSLPIVVVTAVFTGAITVIQAAPIVTRFQATGLLGWGAGFSIFREIGPLLTALMISGRVGANNTAELGTMVVTEQVDALRALAIDPIAFLILPRVIGIVTTLFVMTIYADVVSLVGASLAADALLGVSPISFYNGLTSGLLGTSDVLSGLIKAVVFGIMIAVSSCYFGLATKGGAPGVGRSVNATVVASAAGIFVLDYFVSFILG